MIENPKRDQWKEHKTDEKHMNKISAQTYGENYEDLSLRKRRKVRNIIKKEKEGFLKNI